jgi:hypothetical protein
MKANKSPEATSKHKILSEIVKINDKNATSFNLLS